MLFLVQPLDKRALENIKTHKHNTNPYTHLDNVFNYFWEFVANCLPKSLAPNLLTLLGLIFPLLQLGCLFYIGIWDYTSTESKHLPNWYMFLATFALFWY